MNCSTKCSIFFLSMKTKGALFKVKYSGDKNRYNDTVAKELVKPPTKLMTNTGRERERESSKPTLGANTDGR